MLKLFFDQYSSNITYINKQSIQIRQKNVIRVTIYFNNFQFLNRLILQSLKFRQRA